MPAPAGTSRRVAAVRRTHRPSDRPTEPARSAPPKVRSSAAKAQSAPRRYARPRLSLPLRTLGSAAARPFGGTLAAPAGPAAAPGAFARIEFAHRAASFAFLHGGAAAPFLALGAAQVTRPLLGAVVLGGAGLVQGDGDGLLPAFHPTAAAGGLELAVLVLVHDALHRLLLRSRLLGHG